MEFRLLKLRKCNTAVNPYSQVYDICCVICDNSLSCDIMWVRVCYWINLSTGNMTLDRTSLGVLFASFWDTTPCSSKENHLPSFRKNLLPSSSGEKVVPPYREDAAAGCILGHMIYCWITTPLPLFTRFNSQLVPALPKIKLQLEGTKISWYRQCSARMRRRRWGLFRKIDNIAGLTLKEVLSLSSDKIIAMT